MSKKDCMAKSQRSQKINNNIFERKAL